MYFDLEANRYYSVFAFINSLVSTLIQKYIWESKYIKMFSSYKTVYRQVHSNHRPK